MVSYIKTWYILYTYITEMIKQDPCPDTKLHEEIGVFKQRLF